MNDWNWWGFTRKKDLKIIVRSFSPILGEVVMDDARADDKIKRVFGPFFASGAKDAEKRIRNRIRKGVLR